MKNYKHSSTFEEFISNVYSPVQTTSPFQQPYLKNNSSGNNLKFSKFQIRVIIKVPNNCVLSYIFFFFRKIQV